MFRTPLRLFISVLLAGCASLTVVACSSCDDAKDEYCNAVKSGDIDGASAKATAVVKACGGKPVTDYNTELFECSQPDTTAVQ